MQRFSGNRPRYPQKTHAFRLSLLIGLPVILIVLFFAGTSLLPDNDEQGSAPVTASEDELVELSPEEAYPGGPLADGLLFDKLVLEKAAHRLTAYSQGKTVRVYLVALGENPVGPKEQQGDKRTPEGSYVIDGKNPNSLYYKNIGISYPNEWDRKLAQVLGKPPGGDIKIHGLAPEFGFLGSAHRVTDWTHGCIAVTNDEMDEIYSRTPVGTPIDLLP